VDRKLYTLANKGVNIKQNHGFKRFMLRGKEKVTMEWGLISIAQNIRKKTA
jgi:Transposase DDE domain